MSGHSKWSQIKRQKGISDGKKANVFTKLAKTISIAVQESGGVTDPSGNFKLRLAIEKARESNMPKANIERAIDQGAGKGGSTLVEEGLYEGYAPGNVMIMVETVTDNPQRTYSELRNLFERSGGRLVGPGAVSYMFDSVGVIRVKASGGLDSMTLEAMDIDGVVDVAEEEESVILYTEVKDLKLVQEKVTAKNWSIEEMHRGYKPKNSEEVSEGQMLKMWEFVDKLHDHDDVQRVYTVID